MYVHWSDHTVSLTASTMKTVSCEGCRTKYSYPLERSAIGMGTSVYGINEAGAQGRAADTANRRLNESLINGFECVPCPNCGLYQSEMAEFMKRAYLKWLVLVAIVLFISGLAALYFGWRGNSNFLILGCISITVGVGLVFLRKWAVDRYDPNAGDAEPRIQLGRKLAFVRASEPDA